MVHRSRHNILALVRPFIPSVFGDSLAHSERGLSPGLNLQDHVFGDILGTFGARHTDGAFEDLHAQRAVFDVRPEARVRCGGKRERCVTLTYFVHVVRARAERERGVALIERHAIELRPR